MMLLLLILQGAWGVTVLVDPGHGGRELGAWTRTGKGRSFYEKDIALRISKRIHRRLSRAGFRSFLSRSVDRTVSLEERSALAEKVKADLYISVHVNSSEIPGSRGVETYYLDNSNDVAVKKVEEVENPKFFGEDKMVRHILTDLVVDRTVKSSRALARAIHKEIRRTVIRPYKMVDRGIRGGVFYVLALAKRPAVLLEAGFLSNKKELAKLRSRDFQERYAAAVVRGIKRYVKTHLKK